jgi:uncharacterized protein (DUF1501 family)
MNRKRTMSTFDRRQFLAASGALITSRLVFAGEGAAAKSRLVIVILRGALDGLSAVPPYGDRHYAALRRELAIGAPGSANGALKLDNQFGLHPSLKFLHESYTARELVVFHAIASPYRERSHFDAQDVLENGHARPHAVQSGWLNRALAAAAKPSGKELGVALGQNVPLVMRGPAPVASWSPSRLAALDEDTLDRISDLYASDPVLSRRLADALAADAIATAPQENATAARGTTVAARRAAPATSETDGAPRMDDTPEADGEPRDLLARREKGAGRGAARYTETVRAAANFLRREDGPQVAVFDTTGWDTHANEGAAQGQLALRLGALDTGLRTLKEQLGSVWKDTAVLLITEFGRTAAANGTRGTDHGTGAAAFLVGGAVQGGRVIADWPGLSARDLHEGRDLKPTTDLRAVLKGLLAQQLLVPSTALEKDVFPDSTAALPVKGLLRT